MFSRQSHTNPFLHPFPFTPPPSLVLSTGIMMLLPLTLILFTFTSVVNAGSAHVNQSCDLGTNRLQLGSYQFYSDCDSQTYCSQDSICKKRNCRRDDFPFGYSQGSDAIPDKCARGLFCPDEEDACQPLLPVGSPCQLNRDDQCEAPPNFSELADRSNRGYNFNGSICLNNVCMWANVTLGLPCEVENTPYIGYGFTGETNEFINIVSRGNCRLGLYCDAKSKVCVQTKAINDGCAADKECDSYNCLAPGVCGPPADTPNHFPAWVYVIVVFGIIGGMVGTLWGMYILHRRQRDREREKRIQYWREQNAFRQNILQMRDTATHILAQPTTTPPSRRSTIYGGSQESHSSILPHGAAKSSGLRHYLSDEGSDFDDNLMNTEPMPIERRPDGRF